MAGPRPNRLTTSALKSRILNIAQTSVYQVKLQPPAAVINFLRAAPRGVDYYSQDGLNIELLCRETSLPGQSLATHDQPNDYPGVTEKMVYRKIFDDRTDFTFYVDKRYKVVEFFEGWIDFCAGQGTTYGRDDYKRRSAYYRMNYPIDYKTDALYTTKFEKDAKNSMTYQFIGAFPISIAASPVSYDQSDTLKCTVSFSYMRYLRRRSGAASDTRGFVYRYLTGEKSWDYLQPRSFQWVDGKNLTWDSIWGSVKDNDKTSEEPAPSNTNSSPGAPAGVTEQLQQQFGDGGYGTSGGSGMLYGR